MADGRPDRPVGPASGANRGPEGGEGGAARREGAPPPNSLAAAVAHLAAEGAAAGRAMARTRPSARAPRRGLDAVLFAEPFGFQCFQAVRLLQSLHPDKGLGGDMLPSEECVRFRTQLALHFAPSEIARLTPPTEISPAKMTVSFFGLFGAQGALPRHYSELLLELAREKDTNLRDFWDLFNHRLISLLYRAWEKYRPYLAYERTAHIESAERRAAPESLRAFYFDEERDRARRRLDPFSQAVLELIGMGGPAARYRGGERRKLVARREVRENVLRYYSGLLANRHRSAIGLERLLEDYFGLPIVVKQFMGQWLMLDTADQTCLLPAAQVLALGRQEARLGVNAVVGERVWERQGKFRVRIGPLGYRDFVKFLPAGGAFRPLTHLTRLYCGQQFEFDVQVVLRASEAPECRLTSAPAEGVRLGWDAWIRCQPLTGDLSDPVFNVISS